LADNTTITCALRHFELFSVLALDGGLGAFMHRIEWLEMNDLIPL